MQNYCCSCLICASRNPGAKNKPPLCPIPVPSKPFVRIDVDVLSMPLTERGNKYALVFVDYFTKWPEVFAIPDQSADTVSRVFINEIVCRYGAPNELLSDQGANFLSDQMLETLRLVGTKKINTAPNHPQSDGLVERFHRTLLNMLAKHSERAAKDWDLYLPYVLYAYRNSPHDSTLESPHFLLFLRDARLPTETALSQPRTSYQVDLTDYKTEMLDGFAKAWSVAYKNCSKAQLKQKKQYDKSVRVHEFKPGDRVFIYEPSAAQGPAYKLSRPYFGPCHVKAVNPPNVTAYLIDRPDTECKTVHADMVFPCNDQISSAEVWVGPNRKRTKQNTRSSRFPVVADKTSAQLPKDTFNTGPVTRSKAQKQNKVNSVITVPCLSVADSSSYPSGGHQINHSAFGRGGQYGAGFSQGRGHFRGRFHGRFQGIGQFHGPGRFGRNYHGNRSQPSQRRNSQGNRHQKRNNGRFQGQSSGRRANRQPRQGFPGPPQQQRVVPPPVLPAPVVSAVSQAIAPPLAMPPPVSQVHQNPQVNLVPIQPPKIPVKKPKVPKKPLKPAASSSVQGGAPSQSTSAASLDKPPVSLP